MRRVVEVLVSVFASVVVLGSVGVASAAASFSFPFASDNQGWRVNQSPSDTPIAATWTSTGGAGGGGGLTLTDNLSTAPDFFETPTGFESDHSNNFGGTLSVDLKSSQVWAQTLEVILIGPSIPANVGGNYCVYTDAISPTTAFQTFSYTIDGDHVYLPDCTTPATDAQVAGALADLKGVVIFGEDSLDSSETTTIDNVTLSGGGPPPTTNVPRTLTLSYSKKSKAFKGKLKAPLDPEACAASQKVTVFKKRKGADLKLGSPKTDSQGAYKLKDPGRNGTYYASIAEKTIGQSVCKSAKSGTVQLG